MDVWKQGSQALAVSVATGLLQIGAVEIRPHEPFTWSSGWKSPIYCDMRLVLSHPVLRRQIVDGFAAIIESDYPGVEVIAGTATAGIPHAAMLADVVGLPMTYVRSSAKDHGRQKRVEGRIRAGQTAIVVEDTLSTASSAYSAVAAMEAEGARVLAVFSIFSYDFEAARQTASQSGIPAWRLLDYGTLIQAAVETGYVSADDVALLMRWRDAPAEYGH